MRALGLFLGLTCAALSGAFGCQTLADIEERTLDKDGVSAQCVEYCDTVMSNCTGTLTVYKSREVCLDVCAALDPGDPLEPEGNTVACRLFEAKEAARPGEAGSHCFRAGPGGGNRCGSDCDAWCGLLEQACPADFAAIDGECTARCAGLLDQKHFDVNGDYSTDTLECRLIHVGAALRDPVHCEHAAFNPRALCLPAAKEEPKCRDYCRLVAATCTDENTVYESQEQCLATCEALDPGTLGDTTQNTVGCRKYHAASAATDPDTHCPHASPTGDGHCGVYESEDGKTGNCESYCVLLGAACAEDPDYDFASQKACEDACEEDFADNGAQNDAGYTLQTAESGDTLQCRTLHAVRALEDADACSAALGAAPCD